MPDYKNDTLEHVSSPGYSAPPRKQGKLKAHFRRFWWLHLIIFIIGFLLVLLLLMFVGIPNIAQNGINDAELELESQVVMDPTPDSVQLAMTTISKSKSSFEPWLDSFEAALFLEGPEPIQPFGYITIPRVKATHRSIIFVNQTLEIKNLRQFEEYNKVVMNSETYRVGIRGRMGLKQGGFPKTNVNFNKIVTSKGLNKLAGFKVLDFNISLSREPDGTNMIGKVSIPNASPITLQMGDVTLDLFVDGTSIGNSTLKDLTLKPGENIAEMRSNTDQAGVITAIMKKYHDGIIPVDIVGRWSVYQGKHLTYYEAALQSNPMRTMLDVGPALAGMGVNISSLVPPKR
ncbi:hypothetical protein EJ06DRAFT_481937 [Trichodelitschia bisporula]|uniref:Uncharacterized protein n=1 Tax=Trichodelitschia bisporula TaxID=703511 RepID=A0A6G1HP11_9PEZI|nr:hypothetical protein EJ06DRAFT_481937 [Trichodelitschia bisporula]